MEFNIVLVEPEIPANTGNIGRLCVGMGAHLHLIRPLGFELSDARVKRAGLDYWPHLTYFVYDSVDEWLESVPKRSRVFPLSTKGKKPYFHLEFQKGDYFVFGKETKGLSPKFLQEFSEQVLTIPFPGPVRSFNLSNSVAMVLSEGLRQGNGLGLPE